MSDWYIGMLFTALLFAVLFLIPTIALGDAPRRKHRIAGVVLAGVVGLHLLALPVIAVFGFMDGATQ